MDWELKYELLEKYWAGKTSLEEEQLLKKLASAKGISLESLTEQLYFEKLSEIQEVTLEKAFEDQVLLLIEASQGKVQKKRFIRINAPFLRVAATLLIAIGTFFYFQPSIIRPSERNIAAQNAEEALKLTKESLLLISIKMNKGASYSSEIGKFNQTLDKLKSRPKQ